MNLEYLKKVFPVILSLAFGAIILGWLSYAYIHITSRITSLSAKVNYLTLEIASTTSALSGKTNNLAENISNLDQKAAGISNILFTTEKNVETVQSRVGGFEEKVGTISGTVNTLEKLSKTDPELLQKYSKIFFLNEHYVPDRLMAIDPKYLYDNLKPMQIHALVWPNLKELVDATKKEGVALYIKSAYRSFNEQASIKSAYSITYGFGTANKFSAEQGYSEHQLGTTVDFITTGLGGELGGFEKTSSYQWLLNNAYKYGFILSYYKGNAYYIFEPWHWRYVGKVLAAYLNSGNKHFYDLEQREIDTYLVNIFD